MLYNKQEESYVIIGNFNVTGETMARIKVMRDQSERVVEYKKALTGDFTIEFDEGLETTVVNPVEVVETNMDAATPQLKGVVLATTPKGKSINFELENMAVFCGQYKLEVEAVEACLKGEQKTHRKWGFVLVD